MANFSYTARDKSGSIKKGSLFATDQSAAAASLLDKGLVPILVKEASGSKAAGIKLGGINLPFGGRVKMQDKVIFSRQFATMINAGVPIVQSLSILEKQATSKTFKEAIAACSKKVEGGATLSAALAEHPHIFSNIYVNMVKAGETGGMLDETLNRLADQQEKDAQIVSKVRSAMIYPSVITAVTVGAFLFLMTVIVPKLAVIFEGIGSELPVYTKILLFVSGSLVKYGGYIAAAVAVGIVLLIRYIRTSAGKKVFDTIMLKMPIFGPIIVKVNVARFARTFGSLMASGISVLDALNATSTALGNSVFQNNLQKVAQEVKAGKPVSEPLKNMREFPPIVSQMMAVGEETGQLDSILIKLADFYEKEVDTIVSGITSIIEPILILVLGGMIGFIVISVFGPISELSNAV